MSVGKRNFPLFWEQTAKSMCWLLKQRVSKLFQKRRKENLNIVCHENASFVRFFFPGFQVHTMYKSGQNRKEMEGVWCAWMPHVTATTIPLIQSNWHSINSVGDGLPHTFILQLDFIIYHLTCITSFPHSPLDKWTALVLNLFNLFQCWCFPSSLQGGKRSKKKWSVWESENCY